MELSMCVDVCVCVCVCVFLLYVLSLCSNRRMGARL